MYSVLFSSKTGETAKTASDFQQLHSWLQVQFPANEIMFFLLCLIERARVFPVPAAITHLLVECGDENIVSKIVGIPNISCRSFFCLPVREDGAKQSQCTDERNTEPLEGSCFHIDQSPTQYPINELIDGVAVPPPVNIGFAKRNGSVEKQPQKELVIVYLDIPWAGPIDADIRFLKEGRCFSLCKAQDPESKAPEPN